jgi:hypothetical protein
VPVFLERFIAPVLAIIAGAVILYNPLKYDWRQRISLLVAIFAVAYFVSHSLHVRNEAIRTGSAGQASQSSSSPVDGQGKPRISGDATTYGNDSPAVTGDHNQVTYGEPQEPTKPAPKSSP